MNLVKDEELNIPDDLTQAIGLAESGDTRKSQQLLLRILKKNPRNSKAWLWFARTSDNLNSIETSLKNAFKLSPNDTEILKEIKKNESASKVGCGTTGDIVHCFFCWAPIGTEDTICHYCNSYLDIREDLFQSTFFKSHKKPDLKLVLESFQRYTKVIKRDPTNYKVYFILAMTHINLDQWDEALDELIKLKSLNTFHNKYQIQLEILSDFMNDLGSFFSEENHIENTTVISEKSKKDKKIMIVEDSKVTRTVIQRMLTQEGYKVIEAQDGIEAIAKFKENTPDLILLDIIMPGMSGYQTLSALKKNHRLGSIPVIMLSAKDTLIDKLKGRASEVAPFV